MSEKNKMVCKKCDCDQLLTKRNEQTALAFGMMIGQLSGLLNDMAYKERKEVCDNYKDVYKELKDIWKAAGMQINAIYYKDSLLDNLESIVKFNGK